MTTTSTIGAAREKIASLLLDERCHIWIQERRRRRQEQHDVNNVNNNVNIIENDDHPHHHHHHPHHHPHHHHHEPSSSSSSSSREQQQQLVLLQKTATTAMTIYNLLREFPSLASERFVFPPRARLGGRRRTMYPLAFFIWNSFSPQWLTLIYKMYPQALSLLPLQQKEVEGEVVNGQQEDITTATMDMEVEEEEDDDPDDPYYTTNYYLYQNLSIKASFGCPTIEEYVIRCFLPPRSQSQSPTQLQLQQQRDAQQEDTLLWLIDHLPEELTSSLNDGYLFRHIIVTLNEQQREHYGLQQRHLSLKTIQTFFSRMMHPKTGGGNKNKNTKKKSRNIIHEGHVEELIIAGYPQEVIEYALDAMLSEDDEAGEQQQHLQLLESKLLFPAAIAKAMRNTNNKGRRRLSFKGRWQFQKVHADLLVPRLSKLSWLHLDPLQGWTVDGWNTLLLALPHSVPTLQILGLTVTTSWLVNNNVCLQALGKFLVNKPTTDTNDNDNDTMMRFSFDLIGSRRRRGTSYTIKKSENRRFFESFSLMLNTPQDICDPISSTPMLLLKQQQQNNNKNMLFDKLTLYNFEQCDFLNDEGYDVIDLLVSSTKQLSLGVNGMGETTTTTTSGGGGGTSAITSAAGSNQGGGGGGDGDESDHVSPVVESTSNITQVTAITTTRQPSPTGKHSYGCSPFNSFPTEEELEIGLKRNGSLATQQIFNSVFTFSSMLEGSISTEYSSSSGLGFHQGVLWQQQQQQQQLGWSSSSSSSSYDKVLTGLTIDVSGVSPGQQDITDFLVLFLKSPSLRRLYVKSSDVEISSFGEDDDVILCEHNSFDIARVCEAIRTNKAMKRLELEDLHIRHDNGHISEAPSLIAQAMEHNTTLKVLTINDEKVAYTLLESWISDFKYVDAYSGAITTFYLWLNECGRGILQEDDATVADLIPCLVKAMKPSDRTEEALTCALDAMKPSSSSILISPQCQTGMDVLSDTFHRLSRTVGSWSVAPLHQHQAEVQAALYALLRECPDVWCNRALGMPHHYRQGRSPLCRKRRRSEISLEEEDTQRDTMPWLIF